MCDETVKNARSSGLFFSWTLTIQGLLIFFGFLKLIDDEDFQENDPMKEEIDDFETKITEEEIE